MSSSRGRVRTFSGASSSGSYRKGSFHAFQDHEEGIDLSSVGANAASSSPPISPSQSRRSTVSSSGAITWLPQPPSGDNGCHRFFRRPIVLFILCLLIIAALVILSCFEWWPKRFYHPSLTATSKHYYPQHTILPPHTIEGAESPADAVVRDRKNTRLEQCVWKEGFYQGTWDHQPNASRPYAHYQLGNHYFGRAEMAFRQEFPINQGWEQYYLPWNQYDWLPTNPICHIQDWNVTKVCHLLGGPLAQGHVLFVGDSMTFTMAESLLMMLGEQKPVMDQYNWTQQTVCTSLGLSPVIIQFIRNDALYTSPTHLTHWPTANNSEIKRKEGIDFIHSQPWTPYLQEHTPGLVVLNLGTHIHDLVFYQILVDDLMDYLKTHLPPDVNLVFRTTSAGHPDCWNFTQPITENPNFQFTYEGRYRDKFTWHLIDDYNSYMERQVTALANHFDTATNVRKEEEQEQEKTEEKNKLGRLLMMLKSHYLTSARPDGHVIGQLEDCLHYHLPGVPDWWNRVMIQMLLLLAEE